MSFYDALLFSKGQRGERGYSAYEIAVQNGYEGTEEEWADSFLNAENFYNKSETKGLVIDNLESNLTDQPLSANQGKVLKELLDENSEYIRTEITESIANETTARTNVDNTLQQNIDNEITSRTNADINLQNQISGLASGSPLAASSTSEMTDTNRIYVNTTDGNWYYYNGSAWTVGGIYQSTGIDKSDPVITDISNALNIDMYINPTEVGKVIITGEAGTVDYQNPVNSPTGYDYFLITCQEGDQFTINGHGGNRPRLWCFIDENGNKLAVSSADLIVTNLVIIAPANTRYLIINKLGAAIIYKGRTVDNRLNSDFIQRTLTFKAEKGSSPNSTEISYISHNQGLINVNDLSIYSSQVSFYNEYAVEQGDEIYISGKSGGVGSNFSLIGFYDNNNQFISKFGTDDSTIYTDYLVHVPENAVRCYVNGAGGTSIKIKKANVFNKTVKETYDEIANVNRVMLEGLSSKQLGVLSRGYVCFSSDDGNESLYTNTIPNILEQVYTDTGVKIPFTFALYSSSNVLQTTEKLNKILDMIANNNCSVAYHGITSFTEYTDKELIDFLDSEKALFSQKGITPHGVVFPNHDHDNMTMAICGSLEKVCCAGGAINANKLYSTPRSNMFELYRTSLLNMTLNQAKSYIDYAYEHNYLICFFFHDNSIASGTGTTQKVVDIIEYAIQKNIAFCNIGDIPTLV